MRTTAPNARAVYRLSIERARELQSGQVAGAVGSALAIFGIYLVLAPGPGTIGFLFGVGFLICAGIFLLGGFVLLTFAREPLPGIATSNREVQTRPR